MSIRMHRPDCLKGLMLLVPLLLRRRVCDRVQAVRSQRLLCSRVHERPLVRVLGQLLSQCDRRRRGGLPALSSHGGVAGKVCK
jgi:hypothetical protein